MTTAFFKWRNDLFLSKTIHYWCKACIFPFPVCSADPEKISSVVALSSEIKANGVEKEDDIKNIKKY